MNGFTYTLTLEEPVLANSLAGDTNSARSLPYVPGGLIRGALVRLYQGEKKAGDRDFQRLFLKGNTRFFHAYPEIHGKRALPVPLAWKTHKDDLSRGIENFAQAPKEDIDLETPRFRFYIPGGTTVWKVRERWQVNVHTQRDAVFGRSKGPEQGAVFRYEALPAGLQLRGIVLAEEREDAETIKQLLAGNIMLGKARTAGYGRARVKIVGDLTDDWREDDSPALSTGPIHHFVLTFLSQAILRDENGQITPDPVSVLKERFNLEDIKAIRVFRNTELVGGFNRQWRMPLPQSQALAAGSVFVLETETGLSGEQLNELIKLEQTGLGERTAEGFGRFAISIEQPDHLELQEADLVFDEPQPQKLRPAEEPVVQLMLKRLMRREIDERMMSTVIEAVQAYKGGVRNSQLSRWRVHLRSAIARPETGFEQIRALYQKEDTRNSSSWQQMIRTRVRIREKSTDKDGNVILKAVDKRLTEWIQALLESKADVWNMLGYVEESQPAKAIGSQELVARGMLEKEYSLRLIDAVLASLAKQNAGGGNDA